MVDGQVDGREEEWQVKRRVVVIDGGRVVCRKTNGQAIQSDQRNNISEGKLFTSIACCVAGVALPGTEPTARNRPVFRSRLDKHRPTSRKPLFVFSIFGRLTMCAHHATSAPLFQRTTEKPRRCAEPESHRTAADSVHLQNAITSILSTHKEEAVCLTCIEGSDGGRRQRRAGFLSLRPPVRHDQKEPSRKLFLETSTTNTEARLGWWKGRRRPALGLPAPATDRSGDGQSNVPTRLYMFASSRSPNNVPGRRAGQSRPRPCFKKRIATTCNPFYTPWDCTACNLCCTPSVYRLVLLADLVRPRCHCPVLDCFVSRNAQGGPGAHSQNGENRLAELHCASDTTGGSPLLRACSASNRQPSGPPACITTTPVGKRRLVLGQSCPTYHIAATETSPSASDHSSALLLPHSQRLLSYCWSEGVCKQSSTRPWYHCITDCYFQNGVQTKRGTMYKEYPRCCC